jgi:hypothetical protein
MIYLLTKYHDPRSNDSLFISIGSQTKYTFHVAVILVFPFYKTTA